MFLFYKTKKKLVTFRDAMYVLKDCTSIKDKDKVLFCDLGANVGTSFLFFKKFYKKNTTFFI